MLMSELHHIPRSFLTKFDDIAKQTPMIYLPDKEVCPHTSVKISAAWVEAILSTVRNELWRQGFLP